MCSHNEFETLYWKDGVHVRRCLKCHAIELKTATWCDVSEVYTSIDEAVPYVTQKPGGAHIEPDCDAEMVKAGPKVETDKGALVNLIVDGFLNDVTDRRGWRQEWDLFDDGVRSEIIETWRSIVRHALNVKVTSNDIARVCSALRGEFTTGLRYGSEVGFKADKALDNDLVVLEVGIRGSHPTFRPEIVDGDLSFRCLQYPGSMGPKSFKEFKNYVAGVERVIAHGDG